MFGMNELSWPYSWEERRVLIKDGILYVPDLLESYDAFQFPGFSSAEVFGNEREVQIEYCSGNGAWIADKARLNPHINFVAVEKKFDRVRKIWKKKKKLQLDNLFIVYGEGLLTTKHYFPEKSITQVYVNFPDPWPKTRHWKNRIVQGAFIDEMSRILQDGGSLMVVTDDPPFSAFVIKEMSAHKHFKSAFPDPYFVQECPGYGSSYFEELWREQGKIIRYHRYAKWS